MIERAAVKIGEHLRSNSERRAELWPWLALLFVTLAGPMCLGLTWAGYRRVDLVDVTYVDGCASRTYQIHWQNQHRYPKPFRYEFTGDSVSFVIAVIWIGNGPTLRYFEGLPIDCRPGSGS